MDEKIKTSRTKVLIQNQDILRLEPVQSISLKPPKHNCKDCERLQIQYILPILTRRIQSSSILLRTEELAKASIINPMQGPMRRHSF